jgi:hypothetical protein
MVAVLLAVTGVNGNQFELKMDCVGTHGIVYTVPFGSSSEVLHGILGESTSSFGSYVDSNMLWSHIFSVSNEIHLCSKRDQTF